MIDYPGMGARIKEARVNKRITQEQLSEKVGIGPAHMSHIESGRSIPSLEVFVAIVNSLNCSADSLLCREVNSGREYLTSWLTELVADCDKTEMKIIADMVVALKDSLRRNKPED